MSNALVWEPQLFNRHIAPETAYIAGPYRIVPVDPFEYRLELVSTVGHYAPVLLGQFADLSEAKQAAEADHRRRFAPVAA